MQEQVLEYFNNYFDGTLNEYTTNAEIMEAVYDLIDLTEAVCEEVGLDEELSKKQMKTAKLHARLYGDTQGDMSVSGPPSIRYAPKTFKTDHDSWEKMKTKSNSRERRHRQNLRDANPEQEAALQQYARKAKRYGARGDYSYGKVGQELKIGARKLAQKLGFRGGRSAKEINKGK